MTKEIELTSQHGSPKGTAYVQFRELRSAQMALDAMNGFELAGRASKLVAPCEEAEPYIPVKAMAINEKSGIEDDMDATGRDRARGYGGPKLDAKARMSLMQKLARTEDTSGPTAASAPRPAL